MDDLVDWADLRALLWVCEQWGGEVRYVVTLLDRAEWRRASWRAYAAGLREGHRIRTEECLELVRKMKSIALVLGEAAIFSYTDGTRSRPRSSSP